MAGPSLPPTAGCSPETSVSSLPPESLTHAPTSSPRSSRLPPASRLPPSSRELKERAKASQPKQLSTYHMDHTQRSENKPFLSPPYCPPCGPSILSSPSISPSSTRLPPLPLAEDSPSKFDLVQFSFFHGAVHSIMHSRLYPFDFATSYRPWEEVWYRGEGGVSKGRDRRSSLPSCNLCGRRGDLLNVATPSCPDNMGRRSGSFPTASCSSPSFPSHSNTNQPSLSPSSNTNPRPPPPPMQLSYTLWCRTCHDLHRDLGAYLMAQHPSTNIVVSIDLFACVEPSSSISSSSKTRARSTKSIPSSPSAYSRDTSTHDNFEDGEGMHSSTDVPLHDLLSCGSGERSSPSSSPAPRFFRVRFPNATPKQQQQEKKQGRHILLETWTLRCRAAARGRRLSHGGKVVSVSCGKRERASSQTNLDSLKVREDETFLTDEGRQGAASVSDVNQRPYSQEKCGDTMSTVEQRRFPPPLNANSLLSRSTSSPAPSSSALYCTCVSSASAKAAIRSFSTREAAPYSSAPCPVSSSRTSWSSPPHSGPSSTSSTSSASSSSPSSPASLTSPTTPTSIRSKFRVNEAKPSPPVRLRQGMDGSRGGLEEEIDLGISVGDNWERHREGRQGKSVQGGLILDIGSVGHRTREEDNPSGTRLRVGSEALFPESTSWSGKKSPRGDSKGSREEGKKKDRVSKRQLLLHKLSRNSKQESGNAVTRERAGGDMLSWIKTKEGGEKEEEHKDQEEADGETICLLCKRQVRKSTEHDPNDNDRCDYEKEKSLEVGGSESKRQKQCSWGEEQISKRVAGDLSAAAAETEADGKVKASEQVEEELSEVGELLRDLQTQLRSMPLYRALVSDQAQVFTGSHWGTTHEDSAPVCHDHVSSTSLEMPAAQTPDCACSVQVSYRSDVFKILRQISGANSSLQQHSTGPSVLTRELVRHRSSTGGWREAERNERKGGVQVPYSGREAQAPTRPFSTCANSKASPSSPFPSILFPPQNDLHSSSDCLSAAESPSPAISPAPMGKRRVRKAVLVLHPSFPAPTVDCMCGITHIRNELRKEGRRFLDSLGPPLSPAGEGIGGAGQSGAGASRAAMSSWNSISPSSLSSLSPLSPYFPSPASSRRCSLSPYSHSPRLTSPFSPSFFLCSPSPHTPPTHSNRIASPHRNKEVLDSDPRSNSSPSTVFPFSESPLQNFVEVPEGAPFASTSPATTNQKLGGTSVLEEAVAGERMSEGEREERDLNRPSENRASRGMEERRKSVAGTSQKMSRNMERTVERKWNADSPRHSRREHHVEISMSPVIGHRKSSKTLTLGAGLQISSARHPIHVPALRPPSTSPSSKSNSSSSQSSSSTARAMSTPSTNPPSSPVNSIPPSSSDPGYPLSSDPGCPFASDPGYPLSSHSIPPLASSATRVCQQSQHTNLPLQSSSPQTSHSLSSNQSPPLSSSPTAPSSPTLPSHHHPPSPYPYTMPARRRY